VRLTAYMHVVGLGRGEAIAAELLDRLDGAGLRPELSALRLCWGGPGPVPGWLRRRGEVINMGGVVPAGEVPTLKALHADCRVDPAGAVLYLHVKGATRPAGSADAWRAFLCDGVLTRWRECVAALDAGHDAAGNEWYGPDREADWRRIWRFGPLDYLPHFAGNFWWARRGYVAALDPPPLCVRHDAEFRFIGTGSPCVYCPEFAGLNWYAQA
jgi:hypothetical protein